MKTKKKDEDGDYEWKRKLKWRKIMKMNEKESSFEFGKLKFGITISVHLTFTMNDDEWRNKRKSRMNQSGDYGD